MTGPARSGGPATSPPRPLAVAAVAVAAAVVVGYVSIRVTTTLTGASLPVAAAVLAAEIAIIVTLLAPAVVAIGAAPDGRTDRPQQVPSVDVVVVLRDERLLQLRLALRACRELRGLQGLVVVGGGDRRGVDGVCRAFGVPRVDPDRFPELGTEAGRPAPLLLIVPASCWVAPDAAAQMVAAMSNEVGAVCGATGVHGVVELLGSEGYPLTVDGSAPLAAALDGRRTAPPLDGPVLFRKDAARAVGGVVWGEPRPELGLHTRMLRAGWRTRYVTAPTAFRMAPTDESRAVAERHRRLLAWNAAASPAAANSAGVPERLAALERWSALPRLALLATPGLAAATGTAPLWPDRPALLIAAWVALVASLGGARRLALGPAPVRAAHLRSWVRTLGVDLLAAVAPRTSVRSGERVQFGVLALLLASVLLGAVSLTTVSDLPLGMRMGLGVALVAVTALVRDASTAYRQQRQLPRVEYDSRGSGDVIDLSPTGYTVATKLEVGTGLLTDIDLPYPGGRVSTVTVHGTVAAARSRRGQHASYVEIATDHETFEQLIYFCAVTAPTIRWLGGDPRVVQRPSRSAGLATALSGDGPLAVR